MLWSARSLIMNLGQLRIKAPLLQVIVFSK
jgi:hypothetical protein